MTNKDVETKLRVSIQTLNEILNTFEHVPVPVVVATLKMIHHNLVELHASVCEEEQKLETLKDQHHERVQNELKNEIAVLKESLENVKADRDFVMSKNAVLTSQLNKAASPVDDGLSNEEIEAIKSGNKLKAISLYRARVSCSVKEAKDFIEARWLRYHEEERNDG